MLSLAACKLNDMIHSYKEKDFENEILLFRDSILFRDYQIKTSKAVTGRKPNVYTSKGFMI
jgi:hypothetical protein